MRLVVRTQEEKAARKAQNDIEITAMGYVLRTFNIRFSRQGRILTLDPLSDREVYKIMARNHLKMLLKEHYKKSGFQKKGKELERFLEFFIDACAEWAQVAESHGAKSEFVNVVDEKIQ
jgi:hypothetical protein